MRSGRRVRPGLFRPFRRMRTGAWGVVVSAPPAAVLWGERPPLLWTPCVFFLVRVWVILPLGVPRVRARWVCECAVLCVWKRGERAWRRVSESSLFFACGRVCGRRVLDPQPFHVHLVHTDHAGRRPLPSPPGFGVARPTARSGSSSGGGSVSPPSFILLPADQPCPGAYQQPCLQARRLTPSLALTWATAAAGWPGLARPRATVFFSAVAGRRIGSLPPCSPTHFTPTCRGLHSHCCDSPAVGLSAGG